METKKNTIGEIAALLQSDAFLQGPEEERQKLLEHLSADGRSGVQRLLEKYRRSEKKLAEERARIEKMKEYELKYADITYIAGIDEVGRGPLAGPVVTCAVILPKDCRILYVNDSKQLTAEKRETLCNEILKQAISVGIGVVPPQRIDEINILQATYEAMRNSIEKLEPAPELLLNDAVTIPGVTIPQVPIIKGDAKCFAIAAASIVAKVTRDRMMVEYDRMYPGYQFAKNKGYGSEEHINALKKLGPSPIHRRSFLGKLESEQEDTAVSD
ncbi:MAG: ribonuclease HII [Lachnospiraceae bacterium]|nr:ribonuclease HII [Lachnospiraceae bacterium]